MKLTRAIHDTVRTLLPSLCVACGDVLVGNERHLCMQCMAQLPLAHFSSARGNPAEQRVGQWVDIEAATVLIFFKHGGIGQHIVHEIKYRGNSALGVAMGRQLGFELQSSHRFIGVDVLVPVPLHGWRRLRRGYNQSLLLCEGIAQVFACPIESHAVCRQRYTKSQTHKSRRERMENIEGAFKVTRPHRLEGKHVLLIDDVMTTGATLATCARALMEVPGVQVSIATLAIAE